MSADCRCHQNCQQRQVLLTLYIPFHTTYRYIWMHWIIYVNTYRRFLGFRFWLTSRAAAEFVSQETRLKCITQLVPDCTATDDLDTYHKAAYNLRKHGQVGIARQSIILKVVCCEVQNHPCYTEAKRDNSQNHMRYR